MVTESPPPLTTVADAVYDAVRAMVTGEGNPESFHGLLKITPDSVERLPDPVAQIRNQALTVGDVQDADSVTVQDMTGLQKRRLAPGQAKAEVNERHDNADASLGDVDTHYCKISTAGICIRVAFGTTPTVDDAERVFAPCERSEEPPHQRVSKKAFREWIEQYAYEPAAVGTTDEYASLVDAASFEDAFVAWLGNEYIPRKREVLVPEHLGRSTGIEDTEFLTAAFETCCEQGFAVQFEHTATRPVDLFDPENEEMVTETTTCYGHPDIYTAGETVTARVAFGTPADTAVIEAVEEIRIDGDRVQSYVSETLHRRDDQIYSFTIGPDVSASPEAQPNQYDFKNHPEDGVVLFPVESVVQDESDPDDGTVEFVSELPVPDRYDAERDTLPLTVE